MYVLELEIPINSNPIKGTLIKEIISTNDKNLNPIAILRINLELSV